jgi:hypothetical protein
MAIKAKNGGATGFLARLKRAEAGNVLPMMAMAVVPIAGMVGSGLDMSRAYLVKARLQTACDSAALAARREMGGSTFDTDENGNGKSDAQEEGEKFFRHNFPEHTMGTGALALAIAAGADPTVVEVSASTAVPTTLMRIFGNDEMELSVNCNADQDFVHNDIMLILDVTGSMNCKVGTSCVYAETKQADSRLDALRSAAGALYRALDDVPSNIRIRYGFMPYSMTVNVSRDLDAGHVRTSGQYWRKVSGSYALSPAVTHSSTFWTNWRSTASAHVQKGCVEERSTIGASGATAASPKISTAVSQADIDSVSTTTDLLKWNAYAPEGASGTTGNTRQNEGSNYDNLRAFCPTRARRLTTYTSETAFNTEVNRATAAVGGYTNHDLGLMWGARYLSPTGMFSTGTNANTAMHNGLSVDRHIIFMTDGDMTSSPTNYSAYGMPSFQNRWTTSGTSDSQLEAKHVARFHNACNRARQMGANGTVIWVIALDVGSTADILPCASSSEHFFAAESAGDLEEAFAAIGKEIGKLRLTK